MVTENGLNTSLLKEAFLDALTPLYWVPHLNAVIAFLTIVISNWGFFPYFFRLLLEGMTLLVYGYIPTV